MKQLLRTIYLLALIVLSTHVVRAGEEDRSFKVINAANGLADNSVQIVVCNKEGRMIISTIGNINFYDGTSFSHIDNQQENQYQLPLYKGNDRLYFDSKQHLWLKNAYAVSCVDLIHEKFISDVEGIYRELGCQEPVLDLFADTQGRLWLLTAKGLYGVEQKRNYPVLRDRNLQDLDVFGNQLITCYDNGEEVSQDLTTGNVVHRTMAYEEWEKMEKYTASSIICRYKEGFFQIRNGEKEAILLYFDLKNKRWDVIMETPFHLNNMAIQSNKLYIASEYGYYVYHIAKGNLEHNEYLTIAYDQKLQTNCNTLAFDKQGGLWIGTERRGILYSQPRMSPFKMLTWDNPLALKYGAMMDSINQSITEFNGKRANCMYTDSRGWSWFGTTTGLYLYRTPKSEPVIFTKREGLYNNVVHSVIEDDSHNIWLSTSYGISCILFEGEKPVFVNSFNKEDNVPNESFQNSKAMRLADGTIVMQAIDHVVTFNPKDIKLSNSRKRIALSPKLIKIMVNGNFIQPDVAYDGNVIVDQAITRASTINLKAEQNSLSLIFSGLNYFRPLQTFYRVRVKEIDNKWTVYSIFGEQRLVDSQGLLHLPLLGLKPGVYHVEVETSMFPDVWTNKPHQWVINVNQFWWRSTGVYVILLVLVLLMLALNFFFYTRNLRMRARRVNEEGDMIKKIRGFVDRCEAYSNEVLSPMQAESNPSGVDSRNVLSPAFIKMMLKLIPYVREHQTGELSLGLLSKAGDTDIAKLYEVMSGNLYKSPHDLVRIMRLKRAAELLRTTDMSVEQIAKECKFYTPNFFIGNFFHEYKLTPKEYREEA